MTKPQLIGAVAAFLEGNLKDGVDYALPVKVEVSLFVEGGDVCLERLRVIVSDLSVDRADDAAKGPGQGASDELRLVQASITTCRWPW
jgi:hypothetical protein